MHAGRSGRGRIFHGEVTIGSMRERRKAFKVRVTQAKVWTWEKGSVVRE